MTHSRCSILIAIIVLWQLRVADNIWRAYSNLVALDLRVLLKLSLLLVASSRWLLTMFLAGKCIDLWGLNHFQNFTLSQLARWLVIYLMVLRLLGVVARRITRWLFLHNSYNMLLVGASRHCFVIVVGSLLNMYRVRLRFRIVLHKLRLVGLTLVAMIRA